MATLKKTAKARTGNGRLTLTISGMSEKTLEQLRALAEAEDRSLSAQARRMIEEELRESESRQLATA